MFSVNWKHELFLHRYHNILLKECMLCITRSLHTNILGQCHTHTISNFNRAPYLFLKGPANKSAMLELHYDVTPHSSSVTWSLLWHNQFLPFASMTTLRPWRRTNTTAKLSWRTRQRRLKVGDLCIPLLIFQTNTKFCMHFCSPCT